MRKEDEDAKWNLVNELQWGRNLIVAEGGFPRAGNGDGQSFNGAAT